MTPIRCLPALAVLSLAQPAGAAIGIYDVDPAYRQEVYEILQEMLEVDPNVYGEVYGRVQLLPSGQILVDTPFAARQDEIGVLMAAIADSRPAETPTVSLRYWVLHGEPGGDDAADLPATLAAVIRELEAVHGELGISVLDAATVTGSSGRRATYHNDRWQISQLIHANGEQLNAQINVDAESQAIAVELALTRGQFLVLGGGTSHRFEMPGVQAVVVNWPEAD
jgi:hypothetical protein